MAGSKSNYLEAKLLDHVLGAAVYTPPSIVYAALYSVAPDDTGGGTEISGNGYARVPVNNDLINWPLASGTTTKVNGVYFTFPAATASWGTIAAIGIFDAATSGNLLYWADITSATVNTSDIVRIAPSGITITSD